MRAGGGRGREGAEGRGFSSSALVGGCLLPIDIRALLLGMILCLSFFTLLILKLREGPGYFKQKRGLPLIDLTWSRKLL